MHLFNKADYISAHEILKGQIQRYGTGNGLSSHQDLPLHHRNSSSSLSVVFLACTGPTVGCFRIRGCILTSCLKLLKRV